MKKILLRLPDSLHTRLADEAEDDEKTPSEYIRDLLRRRSPDEDEAEGDDSENGDSENGDSENGDSENGEAE